jgi:hypothetical protein
VSYLIRVGDIVDSQGLPGNRLSGVRCLNLSKTQTLFIIVGRQLVGSWDLEVGKTRYGYSSVTRPQTCA